MLAALPSSAQSALSLAAERHDLSLESELRVRITESAAGGRHALDWNAASVDWLFVRGAGYQDNLGSPPPSGEPLRVRLHTPGAVVVGLDTPSVVASWARSSLATEWRQLGLRESAAALRESGGAVRVHRTLSAKLLARAFELDGRPGSNAAALAKTGQRTEIRLLGDPTRLELPTDLPLKLYFDPRSGPDEPTVLVAYHHESRQLVRGSVEAPLARVRLDRPGNWELRAHRVGPSDHPGADLAWQTATLAFEIPSESNGGGAMRPWLVRLAVLALAAHATAAQVVLPPPGDPGGRVVAPNPIFRELGPAPISSVQYTGRVSALACSQTTPGLWFAAGADGGVWRTENSGVSWTPLTDFESTTSIGALALSPTDDSVVYAGTGEANYANHSRYGLGLLRSTDRGETWTRLAESVFAGRTFSALVVDPRSTNVLYASIARAGGFPELAAAKGHPDANGPVGVFKSTDSGASWTQLAGGLPTNLAATSLAIDPDDPDTLWAGIGRIFGAPGNGLYRSTDAGATWSRVGNGLPTGSSVGRITVAVAPSQTSRLYVLLTSPSNATGGGAFTLGGYRSDDAGANWTNVTPGSIQSSFGWYVSVVSVDPSDPDTVFMGGVTLHRSVNAGASWSNVTPPHVDMHAVAWSGGQPVAGTDGGVYGSSNGGSSWFARNSGLGLIQFYAGLSSHPTLAGRLFGGTQDNGTNRATDGVWQQVFGGDGGWTQVDQAVPTRGFVEFQGTGNLFRSTNSGNSYSFSGSGLGGRNAFLPPYLIDPSDSSVMYYGSHYISKSTNSGTSWSPISGDLTTGSGAIRSLAIAPSDPAVLYAATNDGNVLVSTDSGVQWTVVRSGHPGWPRVTRELFVHPRDAQKVWLAVAAFGSERVLYSEDGGASWISVAGDLPDVPVNTVAVLPGSPDVLFAGTDQGLYASSDGGVHWRRYGRSLPYAPVIDLLLEPRRTRLVVATQGRGAWVASLAVLDADLRR